MLYTQLRDRFVRPARAGRSGGRRSGDIRATRAQILTGTHVAGVCRDTQDSFQGVLKITDHRLHARFAHGGDAGGLGVPAGRAEPPTAAPEGRAGMAEAVARSARTSASFPIGFEPSEPSSRATARLPNGARRRPVHPRRAQRRRCHAGREAGRAVEPLGDRRRHPRQLADRCRARHRDRVSAERPVQRAVVFVVPYTDDPAKPPEPRPDFAGVRHDAQHAARRRVHRSPRGGRARSRTPRRRSHGLRPASRPPARRAGAAREQPVRVLLAVARGDVPVVARAGLPVSPERPARVLRRGASGPPARGRARRARREAGRAVAAPARRVLRICGAASPTPGSHGAGAARPQSASHYASPTG